MASSITGFRKTLENSVPSQVRDLRLKMGRLTEELEVCRQDEAYLAAIARVAGINLDELYEAAGQATVGEELDA